MNQDSAPEHDEHAKVMEQWWQTPKYVFVALADHVRVGHDPKASLEGIEGLLGVSDETDDFIDSLIREGDAFSYRTDPDGTEIVYYAYTKRST